MQHNSYKLDCTQVRIPSGRISALFQTNGDDGDGDDDDDNNSNNAFFACQKLYSTLVE